MWWRASCRSCLRPTGPGRHETGSRSRSANCSIEARGGLLSAKDPPHGRRWLREARAPACKMESTMPPFDSRAVEVDRAATPGCELCPHGRDTLKKRERRRPDTCRHAGVTLPALGSARRRRVIVRALEAVSPNARQGRLALPIAKQIFSARPTDRGYVPCSSRRRHCGWRHPGCPHR
jgi:hypothetical protein